jgi:hypothetical protein
MIGMITNIFINFENYIYFLSIIFGQSMNDAMIIFKMNKDS